MKKGFALPLIIVLIASIGILGFFIWKSNSSEKTVNKKTSKTHPTELHTQSTANQVTSLNENGNQEIQLYSNEKFGYSILHPKNWQKSEDPSPPEDLLHALFFYPDISSKNVITIVVTQKVFTMEDTRADLDKTIQRETGELTEFKETTQNNLRSYISVISYKNRDIKVKTLTLPLPSKGISFHVSCIGEKLFFEESCNKIIDSFTIL